MGETILIAVAVLAAISILAALLLAYASKKFAVKEDPRVEELNEILPGGNCGACGKAGCKDFAEGAVKGEDINCPVASPEVQKDIAKILGKEVDPNAVKLVARVMCNGTNANAKHIAEYDGIQDCVAMAATGKSNLACSYGCFGLGSCVKACQFDAIDIIDGTAVINPEKCTSCGECVDSCPQHIIKMVPYDKTVTVVCSNHDKGADSMKVCSVSCIGCTKCVQICPTKTIEMQDMLAVINHDGCVMCRKCIDVCPTHAIKEVY